MKKSPWRPAVRWLALAACLAALGVLVACATNPATGRSQLSLFDEAEEIALGAEVDREFLSNFRRYEDRDLEAYVAGLGRRLAAVSERPSLPWSFHIVDDEIVNAFALPGGRVYVTRGLLAHLDSEAELAGVLGHEIGHVTARHSVHGLSRQLAITLGTAVGLALFDVGETGQEIASLGLGLAFLKFGRNQERQADQLGVRYMQRAGLDPHGVVDALRVLMEVSHAAGEGGWSPVWLSTHPDPDKRWQRLADETGIGSGSPASTYEINDYVSRLDGLVYGPDLRNGYLSNQSYVQLRDGYWMTFPSGWTIEREGQTLAAQSGSEDAMVMLLPQQAQSAYEAADEFSRQEGVVVNKTWDETLGGLAVRHVNFSLEVEGETLWASSKFVQTPGKVVAVLGIATYDAWSVHGQSLNSSLQSIRRTVDNRDPSTIPSRLGVVTLPRAMNAWQVAQQYSPNTAAETIALLNQISVDEWLPAGRRVKVVRSGR